MVSVTCPWCEEETLLGLRELHDAQGPFRCVECGTTVELVDEPAPLDLAA